jgi:hypothetical protein
MNKLTTFVVFAVTFLALSMGASAWHCEDTDQAKPAWNSTSHMYGPWGDNTALGGNTSGWLSSQSASSIAPVLPTGCTGTSSNAKCTDYCDGTTLREFYCSDRPRNPMETVIFWHDYENSKACNEVPEFGTIAAGLALVGAVLGFAIVRKRK